jgi:hypothetical protein
MARWGWGPNCSDSRPDDDNDEVIALAIFTDEVLCEQLLGWSV